MRRLTCIAAVVFLAFQVSHAENPTPPTLEGVEWELLDASGKHLEMPDGKPGPWIRFDAAKKAVIGNGGCNGFSGTYVSEKDLIRFESVIATRMACDPARNAMEREFLKALENAVKWKIEADQLLLLDGAGEIVARLTKKAASTQPAET